MFFWAVEGLCSSGFRRPVLIQAFHAQTAQGGFAMAGNEDDFSVAVVEVLQAVYGGLDGGAVLRD